MVPYALRGIVWVAFSLICQHVHLYIGAPISDNAATSAGDEDVLDYLKQYNYLKKSQDGAATSFVDEGTLSVALKKFQEMMSIPVTGLLDNTTRDIMSKPRCGHPDVEDTDEEIFFNRSKRYVLLGSRWHHSNLTYRCTSYTRHLDISSIRSSLRKAFDIYSAVTPLKFRRRKSGLADIMVQFRDIEDGKALAYAYQPGTDYGGDIDFDSKVQWTLGDTDGNGFDFMSVALHEIGHSLGLGHARNPRAIMYAVYDRRKKIALHDDDIQGLKSIYGNAYLPTIAPHPTVAKVDPRLKPEEYFCSLGTFDAISRVDDGKIYAFLDDYYIEFREGTIPKGYPKLINSRWKEVDTPISAVVYVAQARRRNWRGKVVDIPAHTLFFSEQYVWKYEEGVLADHYPDVYADLYEGLPVHIDSAFASAKDQAFYVTKGSTLYKLRGVQLQQTISQYPRQWRGVPANVNSAFDYSDRYVLFIKGKYYYEFDKKTSSVRSGGRKPLDALLGLRCGAAGVGRQQEKLSLFDDESVINGGDMAVSSPLTQQSGQHCVTARSLWDMLRTFVLVVSVLFSGA